MTWPFENDTSAITKKLAKKSLKSEKRRNLMIVIAISLAAFLMSMCGTLFFAFQESQNNMATFQASYDNLTEDKIEKASSSTRNRNGSVALQSGRNKNARGIFIVFGIYG